MEVTGETLSFILKRRGAEGAIPNHQENPYRVYFKELFPNYNRKNLSGKRTE